MTKLAFLAAVFMALAIFGSSFGAKMFKFHQKKDHYGMLVDARNVEATFVQRYIEIDEFFYGASDDVSLEIEQSTKERGLEVLDTSPLTTDEERDLGLGLSDKNHTIFLYTGGQGPIEEFYYNSGYLIDLARYYGAVLVFAEHRFYGSSLPFGYESFNESHLPYLTVDQVVADYMNLIYFLKYTHSMPDAKIITFGSFYAGSLASYMRFKYPEHITGALASGAPVKMADDFGSRTLFWPTVTSIYQNVDSIGDQVVELVKSAYDTLNELRQYGPQGYSAISDMMHTCQQVSPHNFEDLQKITRNAFGQLSLHNYPFSYHGFPANVVEKSAQMVYDASTPTEGLYDVVAFYYGLQEDDCIDLVAIPSECADQTGCMNGTQGMAWDFQLCWEVLSDVGSNIAYTMFPNLPWTMEDLQAYCSGKFNLPVNQRYQWFKINYWGSQVSSATNIIWTNGLLDPWYGTGIALDTTPYLKALGAMEGASQGLDLMSPVDGDGMEEYREMELELIGQIIDGTFPSS